MTILFEPTRLNGLAVRNRIAMAPLTRQRADVMGVPKPFVRDYYAQRASAGLIIAEGTQPSFAGQGYCRTPGIHTPDQVAAWKGVTDAVHARGARMFLQLMHAGRIAHPLNRRNCGCAGRAVGRAAFFPQPPPPDRLERPPPRPEPRR